MPILEIFTPCIHGKSDNELAALAKVFADEVAKAASKPSERMAVVFIPTASVLHFAGSSNKPAAVCRLTNIGAPNHDRNLAVSRVVTQLLQRHFNISKDHYYCYFTDAVAEGMGASGMTVAQRNKL